MIKYNLYIKKVEEELDNIKNKIDLNNIKSRYIGKNGILTNVIKNIIKYPKEERSIIGKELNNIKKKIIYLIEDKEKYISYKSLKEKDKKIDITLPGIGIKQGTTHIITKTINEIESFFEKMGFYLVDGNEIDTEFYNFDLLNMPKNHPSRNMHDTFYLNNNYLLRTHTSNMQIHIMKDNVPPFKIISSGKVYRKDSDITHTPMFHQIEGFIVDKNISLAHLKGILINFLYSFFGEKIPLNLRSSYFPFTEPSMEIDIECINCKGKKCSICSYTGWIEVLGCGIIHPNVFKNCNINNKIYKGIAFGMGIERLSMIKYNINDLRLYFENNIEFLKQF